MFNRFCAVAVFILLLPALGQAQRTIGIDWEVPDQPEQAAEELRYFSSLGVSHLQISTPLSDANWNLIDKHGFTVYGLLPLRYPVAHTIGSADSTFMRNVQDVSTAYNRQSSVEAIGLFSLGAIHSDNFSRKARNLSEQIRAQSAKRQYYISATATPSAVDSLTTFRLISVSGTPDTSQRGYTHYIYRPQPQDATNPVAAKGVLENVPRHSGSVLFLSSSWLEQMTEAYPDFPTTLQLYATDADAVYPLPRKSTTPSGNNIIVLLLIGAWVILAVSYNFNPVYRHSLVRYYSGHNFYITDVMQRHLRSMFAGSSILVQHALAGGIILYSAFHTLFTPLGIDALQHHYPMFALFGGKKLAVFFTGFLLTILIELFMLVWLWVASSKTTYISQIVNLYPWSLQFSLILASLSLGFYLAGSHSIIIFLVGGLFLLLFAASFVVTAFDLAGYVPSGRVWFLSGTVGIYLSLLGLTVILLLFSPKIHQVIDLAASLP